MKTHLIVDGQIFQSLARHRGMGRYSEYLLNAILGQNKYQSVTMILSKNLVSDEDEELSRLFDGLDIEYLDLKDSDSIDLADAEKHNKGEIDKYIDALGVERSNIDMILLAPFQEPLVSVFVHSVNKFLVFYDLIPYLWYEQYIHRMPFEKYLDHYKLLFEADQLLAISESMKSDLCVYLGIPESKVVAIHGAAIRSNKPPRPFTTVDLPKEYIIMPTGDDPRKNNAKGVLGFEIFNARHDGKYKLVITSDIHYLEKANLNKLSKDILFTGNVDEAELDRLCDKAALTLFVSNSEGLGLPILEAVGAKSKVVCSRLSVFKEISTEAFYYCDQNDENSIADAIEKAIRQEKLTSKQLREYGRILDYYSWDETARRAIEAMQSQVPRTAGSNKPKIAVFTPRPDGISAIGKVVAETHPSLIEHFDVDYFYEEGPIDGGIRPNYLQYVANYYPATQFSVKSYREYDAVFYHIGNSEYHLRSIANSLYLPGYVIIHDTNISDAYRVMAEKDVISSERAALEAEITQTGGFELSNHLASVIENQLAVMTHSEFASGAVKEINQSVRVQNINLPTAAPTLPVERNYKNLTFGLAGIIADIKGTEVIERLVNNSHYDEHSFLLFGYNYSPDSTMKRLNSYKNVNVATNVTDYDFVKNMEQLDIFVNYRMKYQGETSLSTLEAMRQGVVVIVRNVGWYSELPDDVVIKVETIDEVEERINELVKNPSKLRRISEKAVAYIRDHHNHRDYVLGMKQLMSDTEVHQPVVRVAERLRSGKVHTKEVLAKEWGL